MRNRIRHLTSAGAIILLLCGSLLATVDTRLTFVSNTPNTPSSGSGTLIVDVEAISNNGTQPTRSFQDAFQLNAVFRAQVTQVTFSDELFPSPNYTVTEGYRASDGRVSYIYTLNFNPSDILTSFTKIVRVTIVYTMTSTSGAINWFGGTPSFFVSDLLNNVISGNELAIPGTLGDVSLPVELASFTTSIAKNHVQLNWVTESEINNLGFEISRATAEEGNYLTIASYTTHPELQGQGNSTARHEYSFTDKFARVNNTYWYKLADVDFNGKKTFHGPLKVEFSEDLTVPTAFKLHQNFPNPFNPSTTLKFDIPRTSRQQIHASLVIYNVLGQVVNKLFDGKLVAGRYQRVWNGKSATGQALPTGVYFAVFKADTYAKTIKLLLIK